MSVLSGSLYYKALRPISSVSGCDLTIETYLKRCNNFVFLRKNLYLYEIFILDDLITRLDVISV